MDWTPANWWWAAAGIAVAAELATGTFYLLMVAFGLCVGALAAHMGLGTSAQIAMAALVGGGATAAWYLKRSRDPASVAARENRDVNIDIGERVRVDGWTPERTARVVYRGSTWIAHLAPDAEAHPGLHQVSGVEGNWLVLRPVGPP